MRHRDGCEEIRSVVFRYYTLRQPRGPGDLGLGIDDPGGLFEDGVISEGGDIAERGDMLAGLSNWEALLGWREVCPLRYTSQ